MIITLTDSKTGFCAFVDSTGAQLISLKDTEGREYIWQRDPAVWSFCSPLLFPSVGNCRKGRTRFDGQWYDMPKHGFCRDADFAAEQTAADRAVFRLSSDGRTRRFYPYDFLLSLTYTLKDGILSMDYSVENTGEGEACYCIGSHPGFVCPLEEGERFEDYQLEFEREEHTSSMVYNLDTLEFDPMIQGVVLDHTRTLPLSYELFKKDAIYFDRLASRKVSVVHRDTRRGVQVSYPDFETVAFWTPYEKKAPLLCVEPWNGSAVRSDEGDDFISRHHVQVLNPGAKKSYHMEIQILVPDKK